MTTISRRGWNVGFAAAIVAVFVSIAMAHSVFATSADWDSPNVSVEPWSENYEPKSLENVTAPCTSQPISYYDPEVLKVVTKNACVHSANNFSLARVTVCVYSWPSCNTQYWEMISFGGGMYYKVEGLDAGPTDNCWQTSPQSNRIVQTCNGNFLIVENIFSHIERKQDNRGTTYFQFDSSGYKTVPINGNIYWAAAGTTVSADMKWGVVAIAGIGIIRVDLDTLAVKLITKDVPSNGYGSNPNYHFALTKDGRYLAAGGLNVGGIRLHRISDSCGIDSNAVQQTWAERGNFPGTCPYTDLTWPIINAVGTETSYMRSTQFLQFSYDDGQLYGFYIPYRGVNAQWVSISADGYIKSDRLDYLALGDSYSSGEGDLGTNADGSSYYRIGTNSSNSCHLSTRSYPYLLQQYYAMPDSAMASIACSGAKVDPDYISSRANYFGQGERLSGLGEIDLLTTQQTSLDDMLPGNVPQLDFVQLYKPRIITLTGGGNDVGFAEILKYCATPSLLEYLLGNDTCGFAVKGSELEDVLYNSIDTQAVSVRKLLSTIRTYSPESNVVLIGYPSFIAGSDSVCAFNSGALNGNERDMINSAITHMNNMLEQEAAIAGVHYVDIEDLLVGGRLCEGSEYMTGLIGTDLISTIKGNPDSQMFHPNANAHKRIAELIEHSAVFTKDMPLPHDSIGGADHSPSVSKNSIAMYSELVDGGVLVKTESNTDIEIHEQIFEDGSVLVASGFSEKIDLGSTTVGVDGNAHLSIDNSQLPIGRHLLTLNGKLVSGQSVTLYQFVTVKYSAEDADGDGIINSEDGCNFVQSWIDETTGIDVCAQSIDETDSEKTTRKDDLDPNSRNNQINRQSVARYDSDKKPRILVQHKSGQQTMNFSDEEVLGINQLASHNQEKSNINLVLFCITVMSATIVVGSVMYAKKIKK